MVDFIRAVFTAVEFIRVGLVEFIRGSVEFIRVGSVRFIRGSAELIRVVSAEFIQGSVELIRVSVEFIRVVSVELIQDLSCRVQVAWVASAREAPKDFAPVEPRVLAMAQEAFAREMRVGFVRLMPERVDAVHLTGPT